MKTYRATLQSDTGRHQITTAASSEQAAREIICKAELCPDRAIIKMEEIKPKQTKP